MTMTPSETKIQITATWEIPSNITPPVTNTVEKYLASYGAAEKPRPFKTVYETRSRYSVLSTQLRTEYCLLAPQLRVGRVRPQIEIHNHLVAVPAKTNRHVSDHQGGPGAVGLQGGDN